MKKDNKRKVKDKISTQKEAKETIDMLKSISGQWEVDLETNEMTANFKGIKKGECVPKSGLTAADKQWIADLVITTIQTAVKPIQEDIKVLKEDMAEVKTRLKVVDECLTIKKELKKDDE